MRSSLLGGDHQRYQDESVKGKEKIHVQRMREPSSMVVIEDQLQNDIDSLGNSSRFGNN